MWGFKLFGHELYYIFYNFILYGFFGWIYESSYVSLKNNSIVNRGFLNGPIIPIYGVGATIIFMSLSSLKGHFVMIFMGGMILASALEYVTSYLMEKIFHAKWWDYSGNRFNIKGRVCLLASLFWGVLSILMIAVLQPFTNTLIHFIPRESGVKIAYIIIVVIMFDVIITIISTLQLDKRLTIMHKLREEFTEYIISTKLYETKEELIERYADSQISDIVERFKDRLEDNLDKLASKSSNQESFDLKAKKDEIYEYLKIFSNQYQKIAEYKNLIHARILNAFPNLKVDNREGALKDLKDKLHIKRK